MDGIRFQLPEITFIGVIVSLIFHYLVFLWFRPSSVCSYDFFFSLSLYFLSEIDEWLRNTWWEKLETVVCQKYACVT